MLAFGLGLIIGHCLESWFLCCCGGIILLIFCFCVTRPTGCWELSLHVELLDLARGGLLNCQLSIVN